MASAVAGALLKGAVGAVAGKVLKDQNLLVPLDEPRKTRIVSDQQLKKEVCDKPKRSKKPTKAPPRTRNILNRVLERL